MEMPYTYVFLTESERSAIECRGLGLMSGLSADMDSRHKASSYTVTLSLNLSPYASFTLQTTWTLRRGYEHDAMLR